MIEKVTPKPITLYILSLKKLTLRTVQFFLRPEYCFVINKGKPITYLLSFKSCFISHIIIIKKSSDSKKRNSNSEK